MPQKRKEAIVAENQSPIKRVTRRTTEKSSITAPIVINKIVKEIKITENLEKNLSRSKRQSISNVQVEAIPIVKEEKVSSRRTPSTREINKKIEAEVIQEPKLKRSYKKRQEKIIEEDEVSSEINDILVKKVPVEKEIIIIKEDVNEIEVKKIQIKSSIVKDEIIVDNQIDNIWKQVYVPFNFFQKFGWLIISFYCLLSNKLPQEFKLKTYDLMESITLIAQLYVIVGTILLSTFIFSFLPFIFLTNEWKVGSKGKELLKTKIHFLFFLSLFSFYYFYTN